MGGWWCILTDLIVPDAEYDNDKRASRRMIAHPQAVRAVFFDVGFTLLAPHPSVEDIVSQACEEAGILVGRDCVWRHIATAETHMRAMVRAAPQTWADEQAIRAVWTAYFTELLRTCVASSADGTLEDAVSAALRRFDHYASYALYPDAVPVLRALHAEGLTMGVISDWGVSLWPIMHAHGLNQYFDFAVISAALRYAKPHPHLFEMALKRANAIPDYTIHVGDSYVLDVLGARSMGIQGVLIDRLGKVDPAHVDVPVIRDLYGLLDLLEVERTDIDALGGG